MAGALTANLGLLPGSRATLDLGGARYDLGTRKLGAAIAEWGPFGPADGRPDGVHAEVDLRCARAKANQKAAALHAEAERRGWLAR